MTASRILEAAQDKLPVIIHTRNGKTHTVNHIDYISAAPAGDVIVVFGEQGGFNLIDPTLVTELEYQPN